MVQFKPPSVSPLKPPEKDDQSIYASSEPPEQCEENAELLEDQSKSEHLAAEPEEGVSKKPDVPQTSSWWNNKRSRIHRNPLGIGMYLCALSRGIPRHNIVNEFRENTTFRETKNIKRHI